MSIKTNDMTKKNKQYLRDIRWVTNQLVRQNPDIPSESIISKCATNNFPAECVTVKIASQKRKQACVYFYGEEHSRTYGANHTWRYVIEKLKVHLPMKGRQGDDFSYSFQGYLPTKWSLHEMSLILEHIQGTFDDMVGSNNKQFTGQIAIA